MTKKHFIALAEALRSSHPHRLGLAATEEERGSLEQQWGLTVARVADCLAAQNPRFETDRFIKACEGKD